MPHISEITDQDAIDAARLTGLPFGRVNRMEWGIMILAREWPLSFCFHFKRGHFECGIPGLLTPNIHMITDFLRERGYDLESPNPIALVTLSNPVNTRSSK